MAKNFLLAVCYALWGYPLRKILGHSNCCYLLEKKYLLEQHWFFNSEFKTIQPWNSGSFHMAKGIQSDAAFCDALDLSYCHTFVTEHLSYGIAVYFNGFTVQKLTTKTPKWNVLLDCQVVSNLETMGLQDVKTHIFQSALFPSSWKRNIEQWSQSNVEPTKKLLLQRGWRYWCTNKVQIFILNDCIPFALFDW